MMRSLHAAVLLLMLAITQAEELPLATLVRFRAGWRGHEQIGRTSTSGAICTSNRLLGQFPQSRVIGKFVTKFPITPFFVRLNANREAKSVPSGGILRQTNGVKRLGDSYYRWRIWLVTIRFAPGRDIQR